MSTGTDTDNTTIRQLELVKAERGMAMPYDAERVGQLRQMLVEARKRKLSAGLARQLGEAGEAVKAQAARELISTPWRPA
jgi:hypothetical protein